MDNLKEDTATAEALRAPPDGVNAPEDTSMPPRVQIPNEAHWVGIDRALDRGPIDPLARSVPIVAGFEADENHPVIGGQLRAMRLRTEKLAAAYATAGAPAPIAPPADEAELRRALAERIADHARAQEKLARATEALGRTDAAYASAVEAVAELEAAERGLSESFASEVTRWAGSGDPGATLHLDPGRLNIARMRLGPAVDELNAISVAREGLRGELANAQNRADNCTQHLNAAVKDVLSVEARALADEVDRLEQAAGECWRRLDTLASLPLPTRRGSPGLPIRFDAPTTKVALDPPPRGRVDLAPPIKSATDRELSASWRSYFDRLLGDADAGF